MGGAAAALGVASAHRHRKRRPLGHACPQGVCHRDLKLENTLLLCMAGPPCVKICDFGYSKVKPVGASSGAAPPALRASWVCRCALRLV